MRVLFKSRYASDCQRLGPPRRLNHARSWQVLARRGTAITARTTLHLAHTCQTSATPSWPRTTYARWGPRTSQPARRSSWGWDSTSEMTFLSFFFWFLLSRGCVTCGRPPPHPWQRVPLPCVAVGHHPPLSAQLLTLLTLLVRQASSSLALPQKVLGQHSSQPAGRQAPGLSCRCSCHRMARVRGVLELVEPEQHG
eukprot:COSAG01_NODE_6040_length_3883_cov_3.070296_4_plen_196_part_00